MRAFTKKNRLVKFAAAGAMAAVLSIGGASAASADQHAGGTPPANPPADPGARVLGETLRQAPAAAPAALPITGSDLMGLAALGLGAVAVGSTAVVGSRRRAVRTTA